MDARSSLSSTTVRAGKYYLGIDVQTSQTRTINNRHIFTCYSAWGPDADRHDKPLIHMPLEGPCFGVDSHIGYPALEANEWFGVFVPANTPAETVNRLNETIRAVVNSNTFKTGLTKLAVDPAGETPKEFVQLIKSDFDRWGPLVQASGFTPED